MPKIPFIVLLSILCLRASLAQADVIVGNANPFETPSGIIGVFADGASGNVAPLHSMNPGATNPIVTADAIEFEPGENVLYVADFWGQAIRVYDATASGAPTPLRTLTSSLLGQVRSVRVDRAHEEMVAIAGMSTIATWPRLANGVDLAPVRRIPWGGNNVSTSQINNPAGLALNRRRDEIVVGDYKQDSAAGYPNRILVFARLADGAAAAPLRIIEGPDTKLGAGSNVRIAVDEQTQTIFALVGTSPDETTPSARVIAFAADANGNASPLRVLSGPFTSLALASGEYPNGLAFDEESGHLIVSIASTNPAARGRIVVHTRYAFGNALPLSVLSGTNSGIGSVPGTATVTFDRLFRNGFEGR